MPYFLSIAIPTYNRDSCIVSCLESIFTQEWYSDEEIQIVISDNASTDNTTSVIGEFQKEHHNITYYRNETNLWYDRNLHNAITKSTGIYCWFLSDDEELVPGTLTYLLNTLKTNPEAAYLCMNVSWNTVKNLPDKEIILENNGEDVIRKYGVVGGLISQNIIKKEFYPNDASKHFWSLWIHLLVIYEIIKSRPLILINKELILWQAWWDVRWKNEWKVLLVFTGLKNVFITIRDGLGYNKDIMNKMISKFIFTLPSVIVSAKLQGYIFNKKAYMLLFKEYHTYPISLLFSLPISLVPKFILNSIKKVLWK